MPYDPKAPLENQIRTSVASSLCNLRHDPESDDVYLDCLLLHWPFPMIEQTILAWKHLEAYVPSQIRTLGISNVTLPVLQAIYQASAVKPAVVQNRFYPETRFDVPLRAFCREHGIAYQSFWSLIANSALLKSQPVTALAEAAGVELPAALYALVMDLGVVIINGTTSTEHMRNDLEGIAKVKAFAHSNHENWRPIKEAFLRLVEPERS